MSAGVVKVKTFATLSTLFPSVPDFPLQTGDRVLDIMNRMGIPPKKVTIIFVNNVHAEPHSPLKDGDVLGLFPPIGGG
ncbi:MULTISPECIES: MoaD/ThiS family protein [unclassified Oceanispirochaeta]|uniref:MoaD/ThiS family protein n=1 Tax=unclassified Oceanispirochaeta TaxID=2635722 RepID=UPI000E095B71|nr:MULTISPECIES: MoaD/ThiS family protein [unclassified Oceanispirochaeta]MBF9016709.1 MoaD/ThiS family protein [Oceanispirochaeta sp. M2]NPD73086.1 MoaD/ThiS family protein [Oceanispirochaeta sp. M1]RDG31190.1 MoaD/ThiS family protein [Oceanispirochaeta sp. M1]